MHGRKSAALFLVKKISNSPREMIAEKTAEQKRRKTAYRYTNIDIVLSIMIGGAVQEFRVPACGAPFDSEKRNCYLLTRNFRRNG